jgi:uncharacterized protein
LVGTRLFVVNDSRVYDLEAADADRLRRGDRHVRAAVDAVAAQPPRERFTLVPDVTPQSISLNVSNACNLACAYCYAGQGGFAGAQSAVMNWATAREAIDALFATADPARPITIGFLGGEPFVGRDLIHRSVHYATERAGGRSVGFAVTTNGTLLTAEDVALLQGHRFAVTISVDGGPTIHDALRPLRRHGSSHAQLARHISALVQNPGSAYVGARATVTRHALDVEQRFNDILALGFVDVGMSPLRTTADALAEEDWPTYARGVRSLAQRELARAVRGETIRFTNFAVALRQIDRGAASPYPCGAGGGYFSVASDGTWYACHRAVGQEAFALGTSASIDRNRQATFLRDRHVHAYAPCRRCWARYLCSGGCHQEVAARTDGFCDFVRGWLEFCLTAHGTLARAQPGWFGRPAAEGPHGYVR